MRIINKIKENLPGKAKKILINIIPDFFLADFSKAKLIDKYINKYKLDIFVETGTFKGDTLYRLKDRFKELYSIELSDYYYELALKRFHDIKNIHLIKGDSGEKIESLVKNIQKSIFFWLDGHYSSGLTAKADLDTPIMTELEIIFNNNQNNLKHVILIDDARLFTGANDYPTFRNLKNYLISRDSRYSVFIKNDIIVCIIK